MNSIIFWSTGIYEVLSGESKVAGVQVQQSRWALTFAQNGWNVFCLSDSKTESIKGISFLVCKKHPTLVKLHLSLLNELFEDVRIICSIKPSFVICRGSGRYLYLLSKICRLCRVKLIYFGASDVNFVPGRDIVNGSESYTRLYRKALKKISGFVVQNDFQVKTLKKNYQRDAIVLRNIWIVKGEKMKYSKTIDCIWVSNLRKLKRAEWFLNAAKQLSQFRFVMVGGANEKAYFDEVRTEAQEVDNVDFMGAQSMEEVDVLISKSRLLACTSEYEGFPNTFIQAWANSVPVISTVNPSNLISQYNLGQVVSTEEEFIAQLYSLLNNDYKRIEMSKAIDEYFVKNHDANNAYSKLLEYLLSI